MKKCNGPCALEKDESEFGKRTLKSGRIGLRSFCKECNNAAKEAWVHKNWAHDTARNNAYNKRNSAKVRGHKLKKYWPGTTPEQATANFEALLASQGGKCGLCGVVKQKGWHVDHCHESNKVRGVLCNQCNRGLGYFKDDTRVLLEAVAYIIKHR